jgi:hypothetical protein
VYAEFYFKLNAELLKGKIDRINAMNPVELKAHYLETLGSTGCQIKVAQAWNAPGGQMVMTLKNIEQHLFHASVVVIKTHSKL